MLNHNETFGPLLWHCMTTVDLIVRKDDIALFFANVEFECLALVEIKQHIDQQELCLSCTPVSI